MPKINRLMIAVLLILSFSCKEEQPPQMIFVNQQLNLKYEVVEALESYPLHHYNDNPDSYAHIEGYGGYGMAKSDCTFNNGLVEIKLFAHIGLVGHELRIAVNDSIFNSIYEHYGDIQVTDYIATPISQSLMLSSNDFKIGKTISGSIDFKGIVFTDLLRDITSSEVKFMGNFGCKLKKKKDGY